MKEKFEEEITYHNICYLSKDDANEFENDGEASVYIIDGDLDLSDNELYLYEVEELYVNGNIKCGHLILADASLTVEGSVTCSDFVIGDQSGTFNIKKDLITSVIVDQTGDEDNEYMLIGNLPSIPKLYIANNSYGSLGNPNVLKKYNIPCVGEYSDEDMNKYW